MMIMTTTVSSEPIKQGYYKKKALLSESYVLAGASQKKTHWLAESISITKGCSESKFPQLEYAIPVLPSLVPPHVLCSPTLAQVNWPEYVTQAKQLDISDRRRRLEAETTIDSVGTQAL